MASPTARPVRLCGGSTCWFTELDAVPYVELTGLWEHITGERGDRPFVATLRRLAHVGTSNFVEAMVPGLRVLAFPGQPGVRGGRPMPAATDVGLLALATELNGGILDTARELLVAVAGELGGGAAAQLMRKLAPRGQ